ncbi:MAG: chemotaxis response regulator protein-glutamate methylesterase [Pseudomonadota bacterium]
MSKVRVLVVDDSRTMRAVIKSRLRNDNDIEVCGEAADPYEAREAIKALNPDVVTLDVEMPKMNGLEFLEKIMRLRPTPVIMISTLTQNGAAASIEALAIGAFDVIGKPHGSEFSSAFTELPEKVKAAAQSDIAKRCRAANPPKQTDGFKPADKIVAIGASTGGVEALLQVLSEMPENCPPTVITQHMPETFTTSFAARLNQNCAPKIVEATNNAPLEVGTIYLAPGGTQHLEVIDANGIRCRLIDGDPVTGHRPSVDVLFHSMKAFGPRGVGVILTGMGQDGAEGLKAMRDVGAHTIGQNRETCIVYGMPRVAYEQGGVIEQVPLNAVCKSILNATSAGAQHLHKEAS